MTARNNNLKKGMDDWSENSNFSWAVSRWLHILLYQIKGTTHLQYLQVAETDCKPTSYCVRVSYHGIALCIATLECRVHKAQYLPIYWFCVAGDVIRVFWWKIVLNCTFLSDNSTFVSALKLYLATASPISPICAGGGGRAGCAFSGGESF